MDSELIPTGQKINVDGTNYDFRKTTDLLPRIEANNGFDDAFVVGGETCDHVKEVAILHDKESGDIILDKGHSVNYEIGFQYFNSSR